MQFLIKQMSPQFVVRDIEKSIEFYTKVLGFAIDFRFEDFYAGIIKNGYSIHLKSGKHSIEERKRKRAHEDLDIIFSIENIPSLYAELSKSSVEMIQPLRDMDYGKEFYIADPDGYIIGFVEPLPIVKSPD